MDWKIKITASARQDIREIKQWYKKQSAQALENFTSELAIFIESLQENKIDSRPVYKTYRRLSLKKFPYSIFYTRQEKELAVVIHAVFHNKRDNNALTERLSEE